MQIKELTRTSYYIEFESEEEFAKFNDYINAKQLKPNLKANEVMELLQISRQTLSNYVKKGLIKIDSNYTGKQYRYNYESVLALKGK